MIASEPRPRAGQSSRALVPAGAGKRIFEPWIPPAKNFSISVTDFPCLHRSLNETDSYYTKTMECRHCHETSWMECRAGRSQGGATGPGAGPGPAGNGRATAACARRGGLGEPAADRVAPGPAGHPGTTAEPRPAAIRRAGRGPGVLRQPAFRRSRQRSGARRICAGRRPEPDAPGQPGGIPLLRQGPIEPDPCQPGRPGADVALGDLRRASGRLGLPDAAFGQRDRPRADRAQPAAACRRHARGNPGCTPR